MAGTRLLLQVISVFQIVCLAIWSFYFGFCGVNEDSGNNNQRDLLCTKLLDAVFPPSTLDHQQQQPNTCLPPPPKKSVLLPTAQVSTPLSSNNNIISWEINKEAESVCQKEQVDINNPNQSNHPLWLCRNLQDEQNPSKKLRLVNQDSTLIVYYGNENDLLESETLFPSNLKLPQIFNVRLFLEEREVTHDDGDDDNDNDITANYYNSWMSIIEYWMTYQAKFLNVNTGIFSDDYWPCLEDIHVDLQFISTSNTRNWATQTITSNPAAVEEEEKVAVTQEEVEAESGQLVEEVEEDQVEEREEQDQPEAITTAFLDKPTKKQIKSLLADLPTMDSETLSSSSSSLPLTLVVYIPSILPQETYTYTTAATKNGGKVNEQQQQQQQLLILPSSSESLAEILSTYTTRWITSILMGVPQTMDVDDGTFPTWYTTYYHHFLIDHYFQQQQQQDDNECVDIESNSIDTKINTRNNTELLGELMFRYTTAKEQKQKPESFERHFPIEHYAAIFAPLLFPLLVPQLAGIIREWKRYKEKTKKKASLSTSTTIKGGDENTST